MCKSFRSQGPYYVFEKQMTLPFHGVFLSDTSVLNIVSGLRRQTEMVKSESATAGTFKNIKMSLPFFIANKISFQTNARFNCTQIDHHPCNQSGEKLPYFYEQYPFLTQLAFYERSMYIH